MPTARRCQGCGATLGEPASGASVITCRFCGLAHDSAAAFPSITIGRGPDGTTVRKANRVIAAIVIAVVLIVVGSALIPAIMSFRLAQAVVERTTTDATSRLAVAKKAIPPAELAAIDQGGGWKTLELGPPPGGFDAFDPVAALPWAMDIGRAWATDAVLTRVDVGRVAASGVVDLSGEQGSGYRFVSPGRLSRWTNETDAGSRSTVATGLMVEIKGTQVRALAHEERRAENPPAPASLALDEILERARRGRGFADRSYYSGYLIHLPREGWVWYFRAISGDGSFPRVRARDGRTYPY